MECTGNVTVIGAGIMGRGIAYIFLAAGRPVALVDVDATALENAAKAITALFSDAVERGKLRQKDVPNIEEQLHLHQEIDDFVSGSGLVVETATENIEIKKSVLAHAARYAPSDALFATNTSALSITEIGSALDDPSRLIGMHFFNPVHKIKLVELVRGLQTSDDTLAAALAWLEPTGKETIVVNEVPGFTTSRMSALMGNEAMYMLAEGVASADDIDKSQKLAFNHPMGPLELGDLTGWDTRLAVLKYLHQVYGDKFRPCPLIEKMVKAGWHGRKSGRGIYTYDSEGRRVPGSGLRATP
ncbi:MAG: 3-hydroxyacyl-CoA dehydrogenase NAD-binding domain-containing protein [Pseudomonadales bacterium]|jgi:3-hydroxybutyryl-CoA dehydrogenase|tara:strand:+ start:3114 stop:4013 length:900 start_codon:yes stop_codon:yes gene_type:complete